ncbi:uncharacterized protein LOC114524869 isoform X2 [Dendronephthya gigantea]|uniref:uncharacterized protein LOC114524869 isoform X2 n=1 Tax=Dendronephthya gigantea TaxID=151771 RepID=UPI00106BFFB4|nr:uncharacterized protein LOC114524869 isoform X2 [Dendronephthya gigantea]
MARLIFPLRHSRLKAQMQLLPSLLHKRTVTGMHWDREVDVAVIGSGLGGMTSALCLKEMGIDRIEVFEKAAKFGGASAVSGGGIWIPNSHYAKASGSQDSVEDTKTYLDSIINYNEVPEELVDSYIENGPKMLEFVTRMASEVKYVSLEHYPDYHSQSPGSRTGGRSLEPMPLNWDELGDDMGAIQESHFDNYILDRWLFTQTEAHHLITRTPEAWKIVGRELARYFRDTFWRKRNNTKKSRRLTLGIAGIARMFLALKNRHIPVTLNCAMTGLITESSGRVIGIKAKHCDRDINIKAEKGVVLATGGFEYNPDLRKKYLPKPSSAEWSATGIRTNTGDALLASLCLGAKTRLLDSAWWGSTVKAPDDPSSRLLIIPKTLPGSIVVNMQGKRIANESKNYMSYGKEFFASHSDASPNYPSYLVFDRRFRELYYIGPLKTKHLLPDKRIPNDYFTSGFLAIEKSIDALADKLGIDKVGLNAEINKFNDFAKTGKDEDFKRGDTVYDRYYSDPNVTPNPCLHSINQAPFYAMRVEPGDIGTHGGMDTNSHAQVLKEDGSVIEGLYAIGNCAAAILPSYPGPGSTLGPAMTFGYQAAKHISGFEH